MSSTLRIKIQSYKTKKSSRMGTGLKSFYVVSLGCVLTGGPRTSNSPIQPKSVKSV
jgi:hypothetical protein